MPPPPPPGHTPGGEFFSKLCMCFFVSGGWRFEYCIPLKKDWCLLHTKNAPGFWGIGATHGQPDLPQQINGTMSNPPGSLPGMIGVHQARPTPIMPVPQAYPRVDRVVNEAEFGKRLTECLVENEEISVDGTAMRWLTMGGVFDQNSKPFYIFFTVLGELLQFQSTTSMQQWLIYSLSTHL